VSPVDGRGLAMVAATYVVVAAEFVGLGTAIVRWWDPSSLGTLDADVSRALESIRTDRLTTVSERMSQLSDTYAKIAYGIVLVPVMLWLFRRWHEWTLVFGGLLLEVSIFVTAARIVGRERPPVEQLEQSHTASFPSGHIAAATTFFVALGVVVLMRTRRRGPRVVAWTVMVLGPLAVTWGRLYMGMHHVTDAVGGMVIGVSVVTVVSRVVHRTLPPDESAARHDELVGSARSR